MDIFGVITKLKIRGHFYSFYGLFRSKYRMGGLGGLLKFQIFFGELEIPDIFLSGR